MISASFHDWGVRYPAPLRKPSYRSVV